MARSPYRPHPLRWQVFRGSAALADGILTPHQLRSSAWVRVRHDVYADARLDRDHRLACEATALWLPAGAAFAGPSAAYLYGVEHAAGYADDVHVVTPPDRRIEPQQRVRVHHALIAPDELTVVDGVRRTTPARAAWDVAGWLPVAPAVAIVDGLLRLALVDRPELLALVAARPGRRGVRRAGRVFDFADHRAQSPPESRLRVRLELAGLPRPVPQYRVVLPGGTAYHPDLAWPHYRVAVEYDGVWHAEDSERIHLDRRRLNRLVAAGWVVLHVTSRRLQREFPGLVREAADALRARGWRG